MSFLKKCDWKDCPNTSLDDKFINISIIATKNLGRWIDVKDFHMCRDCVNQLILEDPRYQYSDKHKDFVVFKSTMPLKDVVSLANSKTYLRPMVQSDIKIGQRLIMIGDDNDLYYKTIDEVLNPSHQFKAFVCDDGCRYGLDGCWILDKVKEDITKVKEIKKNIGGL